MSAELIQYYNQQSDFNKKVIIDLLEEIIEFSKKYRDFKDKIAKDVRQGKKRYLFPISAKEGFHINGITFFTKKYGYNQSLGGSIFGDLAGNLIIIRYARYDFINLLAKEKYIDEYHFSDEAKKEMGDFKLENMFQIENGKVYIDPPEFRFYEKGFGIDSNQTFLLTEESRDIYLMIRDLDGIIQKSGRQTIATELKKGILLDEFESIGYKCSTIDLIKLHNELTETIGLSTIKTCSLAGDELFINGDIVKLAEKSQLFLNLIARYFFKNKDATQIHEIELIEFYRKNKDAFTRLNEKKFTYTNIKNSYIEVFNKFIKKRYIFQEILIIEKTHSSFLIKLEKVISR